MTTKSRTRNSKNEGYMLGAHVGLYIMENQRSYYNVVTVLNYIPRQ
jgi:hypothetical protein